MGGALGPPIAFIYEVFQGRLVLLKKAVSSLRPAWLHMARAERAAWQNTKHGRAAVPIRYVQL